MYPAITLNAGAHKRVQSGFPWLYSNEVQMSAAKLLPRGSVVTVQAANGAVLGLASFNAHTLIAARMLTPFPAQNINTPWLAEKLLLARGLRERLGFYPFCRLIHAEGDGLPGLIIDCYGDVVVVQPNIALWDTLWPELMAAIIEVLAPKAIVRRADSSSRALEGLPQSVDVPYGVVGDIIPVQENGLVYLARPLTGQKTGWFYDQRPNRAMVKNIATGTRMLDVYSHTGGFALAALAGGATHATALDSSAPALEQATQAAAQNNFGARFSTLKGDAFDLLPELAQQNQTFDLVVADPPAFVKSRKDLASGSKGYRKLTRQAASLVAPRGYLLLASCSHHMSLTDLQTEAARGLFEAKKSAKLIYTGFAGADHPVQPALAETAYLKALLYQLY